MKTCHSLMLLVLLVSRDATATPILTIQCGEPIGHRFDVAGSSGEVKEHKDGFTGVRPLFIIDDAKPQAVTIVWGSTITFGTQQGAKEASILMQSEEQIAAIRVAGGPAGKRTPVPAAEQANAADGGRGIESSDLVSRRRSRRSATQDIEAHSL